VAIVLTLALTFINFVSVNAARVVVTLYALTLGAPASAVGIIGGLFFVFPLLLSWPIGAMCDRLGARPLLLAGAVSGVCALAVPFFWRDLPALYIAATLSGFSLAFYHVTLQYLIGTLSAPLQRSRNFANFSLVGAVTSFLGPLLAGFTIDNFGHAIACLTIAVFSALAFILLTAGSRLLPAPVAKGAAPATPEAPPAKFDRALWRMLTVSGLAQLGTDLFQFYMPIYGYKLGLTATAIGMVLSTFAVAAFIVRVFLTRLIRRMGPKRLLAYSFSIGAAGFFLVPAFEHALMLSLVAFAFGLGMGCGVPLTLMLMYEQSTAGRPGRALGLRLTTNNGVRVVGPVIFGAIGSAFGVPPVFWISALLMGSGAWLARAKRARAGNA